MKRGLIRIASVAAVLALTAAVALAQPTTVSKSSTPGTPTEKTQTLTGTVVEVEGNTLLVKMSNGALRVFNPPPDRRFIIDGKELSVRELQPGTTLKASVNEITTPVTDRTVQTLAGKVWHAAPPTVILTLENGENRMFTIPANSPIKFHHSDGREMTVFDLRKGMNVRATKVTEAPRTEFVSTVAVTGSAPRAGRPSGNASSAPTGASATSAGAAGATAGAAAATAGAGGATAGAPGTAANPAPRTLPKTGSPLPLLGLAGLVSVLTGATFTIRRRRQLR